MCIRDSKPPGIRLRFGAVDSRCGADIRRTLDELVAAHVVAGWSEAPYEEEVFQFGGQVGLELAQWYFTVEGLAVAEYHRLRLRGEARLAPPEFSVLLLDRLLRSVTNDDWEVWDIWCNMRLTGRLDGDALAPAASSAERSERLLRQPAAYLGLAGPQERSLYERYVEFAEPVCAAVRAAEADGALLWGLRRNHRLDDVVKGAKGEFELILRLAAWSSKQWVCLLYTSPSPRD